MYLSLIKTIYIYIFLLVLENVLYFVFLYHERTH